jgi:hypothetical protein
MERQLLEALYQWLFCLDLPRRPGVVFSDRWIVLTYLWAVICDRPTTWACKAENWPASFAWFTPPKDGTMSRRLATPSVQAIQRKALRRLNPKPPPGTEHWVDGKPLTVGGSSKDPDARAGRGAGMMAKGYKLHALWAATGALRAWFVEPLNASEPKLAVRMAPVLEGPGFLVGDHLFDWRSLYDVAGAHGIQLVVTPERGGSGKPGRRHQSPYRVAGLKLACMPLGRGLLHRRYGIDRLFGQLGNAAGGLGPLPNWVRRRRRVTRWVQGKLLWFCFRRWLKIQHLRG